MNGRTTWAAVVGSLALLAAVPADARGQAVQEEGTYSVPSDSADPTAGVPLPGADSLGLVPREVFVYPMGGRRDPFQSPAARGGEGPTFEALSLAGVIYAPEMGSVAVVVNRASGRRHRLRVGDVVGSARLVEVGPNRAVFRITAYGTSRRAVLRLGDAQERELQP